jgi:hypothetical protein
MPMASADEDTPMKGEVEAKEEPSMMDLNATVNQLDESRGFATPNEGAGRGGKKSSKRVAT